MLNSYNHIISTVSWNTFLDQKERAAELQGRLSAWSGINMQKEINEVFSKLCPPDQTWRIDQLDLDLGTIEMDSLESDLARRLRMQLTEKLTNLIIYADKAGQNNIEITNQYDAPIDKLRSYLLNGVMPWNYKASDGSLNQLLSWQFQHNRQMVIAMLKEVGVTHEDIRRRMAWQINEPNIQKIIEGFEPGDHEQITRFSNELIKVQTKENVVRAGAAEFKKNVWLWILNYLLTERGTLFNKLALLKSSIVQMAGHYNIGYEELLQLLNDAVEEVSKSTAIKADFLLALKSLVKEDSIAKVKRRFNDVPGVKIDDKTARLLNNASKITAFIKKSPTKEGAKLIDCLLPGGARLMQQLIKEYTSLLQSPLKGWAKQKISSKLKEIFWRTIVEYASHKGNTKSFQKLFTAAVVFHLPITKADLTMSSLQSRFVAGEQACFQCSGGDKISFAKVFLLIEQCLKQGTGSVVENGNTFMLHEMIAACLEHYSITSEDIQTLKAVKGFRLTASWQQLLKKAIAGLDIPELHAIAARPSQKLLTVYRKGLITELLQHLIVTQQLPFWFKSDEQDVNELMNDIIIHYPEKLLIALKKEVISESRLIWLSSIINLPLLVSSFSRTEKARQPVLAAFEKFYTSLENISIPGVACSELQQILFRKLIGALTINNWRSISPDKILGDLLRQVCAVKNVSKAVFIRQIVMHKHLMPSIFQLSMEKLQEDISAKPASSLAQHTSKKIHQLMKNNDKRAAKTGTPVRNAGIVLLNSYIPMLFSRLNLMSDKKFKDDDFQEQALHYLQYVATGMCHSEETELALNKVLCGLPLSHPAHDGLDISEESKNLIEGLISAAINYWSAIGNCSVEGFRGNWLVRNGLLIEQEDKWELVVEKRAYDILINHSPFSFSIIKYTWMNKPLHVSWAY